MIVFGGFVVVGVRVLVYVFVGMLVIRGWIEIVKFYVEFLFCCYLDGVFNGC